MRELVNIIRILKGLEDQIRQEYKAEIIGVFGSYARGEQKESSDIDILVRFLEGSNLLDLVGIADFLEEELKVRVDIVPVDIVRKEIKDHVFKEAVYL